VPISVDWLTKTITVPKSDTTLVDVGPPEIREYDIYEKLWKELKAIEDNEEGIVFDDMQSHNTTVTIGGITLAHVVLIINGFTVTFEAGAYQVNCLGANHNVLDIANMNAVALRSANSAGLIVTVQGSGVTEQDKTDIANEIMDEQDIETGLTFREGLRLIMGFVSGDIVRTGSNIFSIKAHGTASKERIAGTVDPETGDRVVSTTDVSDV